MRNSKWIPEIMSIFVVMILFSSSWLMAKDEIMISHAEAIGGVLTLTGAFEIKPGKSSKGAGSQIVVTLDGEVLEIVFESPDVIEALMPSGLEEGTHRVAVCEAKDKECPDLENISWAIRSTSPSLPASPDLKVIPDRPATRDPRVIPGRPDLWDRVDLKECRDLRAP